MFDRIVVAMVVAGLVAASCGSADGGSDDSCGRSDVTVFAAASLTDAFTELGEAFTAANPDVEVTFNFAGSSELVAQIAEGAPADVFASADLANMAKLTDAGLVAGEPAVVRHQCRGDHRRARQSRRASRVSPTWPTTT